MAKDDARYERVSWTGIRLVIVLAVAGALFNVVSWAANTSVTSADAATPKPHVECFEDEVIVWTGNGHDKCMPIDDLVVSEMEKAKPGSVAYEVMYDMVTTALIEPCINGEVHYTPENDYERAELLRHRDAAVARDWECRNDVDNQYREFLAGEGNRK